LNGSADRDGDGIITITDAHRYTGENVKRWAFQKGLEQNPTLDARISGDIPLVHVGKKLERQELVDKSVIIQIELRTRETETPRETMENLCGSLLQFAKASEIEKTSEGYRFPYGSINSEHDYVEGERKVFVNVSFYYKKENWDKIDEVIKDFDKSHYWNSITYLLAKRMNIDEIVKKCKESAFNIDSFRPEKGKELIVVNTEAWLDTRTAFQNLNGSSFIRVFKTHTRGHFPNDFYSTLSPENMIEFIKSCLE